MKEAENYAKQLYGKFLNLVPITLDNEIRKDIAKNTAICCVEEIEFQYEEEEISRHTSQEYFSVVKWYIENKI